MEEAATCASQLDVCQAELEKCKADVSQAAEIMPRGDDGGESDACAFPAEGDKEVDFFWSSLVPARFTKFVYVTDLHLRSAPRPRDALHGVGDDGGSLRADALNHADREGAEGGLVR